MFRLGLLNYLSSFKIKFILSMLFLVSEQVNYCKLTRKTGRETETFEGISYQDKLFRKIKIFTETEKSKAIEYAKILTLESKGHQLVLVVEEVNHIFAIWQEDSALKVKDLKHDSPSEINLRELVTRLRDIGGIRIEDRKFNLINYPRCFLGDQLVEWLIETLDISERDAIEIGQRLIDEQWIHHVTDEHRFKNEYLFYRFYWDEDK